MILATAIHIALAVLMLALILTAIRVIIGPTLADRVLALDQLVAIAIGFIAVIAVKTGFELYIDIALALGLVGFLTTAAFARAHLADPESAVAEVQAEVTRVLGLGSVEPSWTHAHRWTFARAASTHPEPFVLLGGVAVCGDAWGGQSSVATAWASGDALGRAIAARG